MLDELDTTAHTAQQLNTLRSTWLGDSRAQLDLWTGRQEGAPCHAKLSLCLSLLERSLEKAVEIGGEWLYDTVLTGAAAEAAYARVVSQLKLRMEQLFIQQGNEFASTRGPRPLLCRGRCRRSLHRRELLPLPVQSAGKGRLDGHWAQSWTLCAAGYCKLPP